MNKLAKVFTAELIGTFVFLGVIIHIVSKNEDNAWIKIGLTLAVAILFLGSVSGGKFNPAVSFMFFVAEKTSMSQFLVECGAQIVGALVALYLYKVVIR
jgi:glycerol uptake facilitator-like aquaporin|tara:strand:+ start:26015 stop:26311 length:297 start_codon:yes stop_codon:yes gene_type:complete